MATITTVLMSEAGVPCAFLDFDDKKYDKHLDEIDGLVYSWYYIIGIRIENNLKRDIHYKIIHPKAGVIKVDSLSKTNESWKKPLVGLTS